MKTSDYSDFIEKYISGEMGESEKVWFQKELDGNENLRQEVILREQTDRILKEPDIIKLRNKLSQIENSRKKSVLKSGRHVYLTYAAVILGLVIIGSLILLPGSTLSGEEVISKYYKTYEPPSANRSAVSLANDDFKLGLEYYNSRDYRNAAVQFSKVLKTNPGDMQSELLNGVSYFEENQYPDAERSFVNVITDDNNLFIETAKWYLALCYINTGDKDAARKQLSEIAQENGYYSDDAKKILKRYR